MQHLLSDHNREGHVQTVFDVLVHDGTWLELVPMKLSWFRDVGLSIRANDEIVWRFCQENDYLLLTGNRSTRDGDKLLELTIQRLITPTSLPVLTIGNLNIPHRRGGEPHGESLTSLLPKHIPHRRGGEPASPPFRLPK